MSFDIEYEEITLEEVFSMAYHIGDECIGCGACAADCPTSCIVDDGGVFKINEADCIECGACAGNCPVGAPKLD